MPDSASEEQGPSQEARQPTRRSWQQIVAWSVFAAASIAVLVGGGYWLYQGRDSNPGIEISVPTPAPVVVQVSGAVLRPGVYELPNASRIQDLLDAAGGAITGADIQSLNLARSVVDGERIDIPFASQPEAASNGGTSQDTGTQSLQAAPGLIDLNTATKTELETLPNIGPARADLIIAFRQESGPIGNVDDLLAISGIGPATVDAIRDLVLQP